MGRSAIISAITRHPGKRPELNVNIEEEIWFAWTAQRSRYNAHRRRFMLFLHHLKTIPHKENIAFFPVQSFLQRNLGDKMNSEEEKFWIGLTDAQTEGTWLWADGSPLSTRFECWETPFCLIASKIKASNFIKPVLSVLFSLQFDILELQGAR